MANVLSIVSYKIFPADSGGKKYIASFNEYLSKYHSLYCITVRDNIPSAASYKIINEISNSQLRYINIFYFRLIKKFIKENKITHVILEHPYLGWLGILLQRFCKVKLIIHSHNIEAERFKTTGKWWWNILFHYEKYIHTKADFTFCITENDREYFINNYKIPAKRIAISTYGISWHSAPSKVEKELATEYLHKKYSMKAGTIIYLFNGVLDYKPNLDAVKTILERINPLLIQSAVSYKIIICGRNLPHDMNELKRYEDKNIIYTGFVEDISIYYKGADVFINPVTSGGGIKTKLVEALGYDLEAVSTDYGAIGVDENICNGKLLLCVNEDWKDFAGKMISSVGLNRYIQQDFFDYFYWDNIAKKAAEIINDLT
jgi:polysaccharide biosynthesis protein PslH